MLISGKHRTTVSYVLDQAASELRCIAGQTWFRLGLGVRLMAIVLWVPELHRRWFVPFLFGVSGLDPYTTWVDQGGDPLAWPYGPIMTLAHSPTIVLGWAGSSVELGSVGFGLTLVAADIAALLALRRLVASGTRTIASRLWWWSPASLVITYWHGQTDLVPLTLLLGTLASFRSRYWRLGGLFVGLSIAAKLTMLVAPPFFFLWLGLSRRNWRRVWLVALAMLVPPAVALGAFALSPGAEQMIFGSPLLTQAANSFEINGISVMLLPGSLLCLLFTSARVKRQSFQLMLGLLGTAFMLMAAVVAIAPGWWLWALPFLALYAANSRRSEVTSAVWAFSVLLGFHTLLVAEGASGVFFDLPHYEVNPVIVSLTITLVLAFGFMLLLAQFRSTFKNNDPYGLAIRPLVVGIAGDSGSGKDTLSTALARVFGENEVVAVSGDDYHTWERGSPMWKVWTHLNPSANQLARLTEDLRTLVHGGAIQCRAYDHGTGRFEPRRRKNHNDVVLVSGLHALYSAPLREVLDVKIYLAMSEDLRRHLKVTRDTLARNQPVEKVLTNMERRVPDYQRFIAPQEAHADLVFHLKEAEGVNLETHDNSRPVPLRVEARARRGLMFDELARLLTSFCWCETYVRQEEDGEVRFVYEGGDLQADDVEEIVSLLIPDCEELIAMEPRFEGGATGVMQLLVLMQVEASRRISPFSAGRRYAELG